MAILLLILVVKRVFAVKKVVPTVSAFVEDDFAVTDDIE